VRKALDETGALLIDKYGFDPEVHAAYTEKMIGALKTPTSPMM
jgi:hypothetical protein